MTPTAAETPDFLYRYAERSLRAGRLEEADRAIRRCIKLAPNPSAPHTLSAIIALNLGDIPRAAKSFGEGLKRSATPQEAAPNRVGRGRCLATENNWQGALAYFVRARRACPNYVPALEGEAEALMNLGRYEEGGAVARAALRLQPHSTRCSLILARCALFQGRIEEAERGLRPLLAVPEIESEVRFYLAGIARAKGKVEEACAEFRRLVRERPNNSIYYELAKSKRFDSAEDSDFKLIRRAFDTISEDRDGLPSGARLILQFDLAFALGKAEEDARLYAQACEHFALANRLHGELEPADLTAIAKQVEKSRSLDYESLAHKAGSASEACLAKPALIISPPRSGSSLLEQMLGAHPTVTAVGEQGKLLQAARDAFNTIDLRDAATADKVAMRLRKTLTDYPSETWITDKALDSYLYAGLIAACLPQTRFIFLDRHPLDMAWSQYSHYFAPGLGWTYSLETIGGYVDLYNACCALWRKLYPERFISVQYEALVAHPERELRRILEFLGLPYDERCLHFEKLDRPVWTASNAQVREPLNRRGIGRWLFYRDKLQPLHERLKTKISAYEARLEKSAVDYPKYD